MQHDQLGFETKYHFSQLVLENDELKAAPEMHALNSRFENTVDCTKSVFNTKVRSRRVFIDEQSF